MTIGRLSGILGVVAAGSFLLGSTAVVASTPAPAQQVDPWAVLTAMSNGAPAAAMCGAAAAAATAQAPGGCVLPVVDAPPPVQTTEAVPPPPPPVEAAGGFNPLWLALLAIAVGVGIFLAVNNNGGSNSPA
jgi:hypothetical protein